jgi:hypothetical protein
MRRQWVQPILFVLLFAFLAGFSRFSRVEASDRAQLPTGNVPTVTSTPSGAVAYMLPSNEPHANLRSGPHTFYDKVGVLVPGQRVPVKGRSVGGDWLMVDVAGIPGGTAWVYSPLMGVDPPNTILPIVEPPPSPTPERTATIDPTLAARFVVPVEPTRLPTYTAPPPLVIPTFMPESGPALGNLPMGFVILGLAVLGVFLGIVAFSQGR